MKRNMTTLGTALVVCSVLMAQPVRYQDEIFTDIVKIENQHYGTNVTVFTGEPMPQELLFDLYMPAGDSCVQRPLVVVLHSGTFLPRGFVAPVGDKDDYTNVQVSERLARMGYVAASIQYRVGWNPLGDDVTRRSTVINAAYRSVQDLYTFIRFVNMTIDDLGNPFGIDPSRLGLFGIGTGAFVAFNAAVLSQEEVFIDKYRNPITDEAYIDTIFVGDIYNTRPGLINVPNHVGYAQDFHFAFGLDGAIGDSSWLETGPPSVPLVAGHVVSHPTTPYGLDDFENLDCDLPVFAAGQFVVNVAGSLCIAHKSNLLGINDPLGAVAYDDPVSETLRNNSKAFGEEHLWAINLPGPQVGPWQYWDAGFWSLVPCPFGGSIHDCASVTNPDMSIEKANAYIDTALWFFAPRAYTALELSSSTCLTVGTINLHVEPLNIYPNPVVDVLQIRNPGNATRFTLTDPFGREIQSDFSTPDATLIKISTGRLSGGVYLLSAYDTHGRLIANARVVKL